MSNSEYHSLKDSYSSTQLKYLYSTSPCHFKAKYIDGTIEPSGSTAALALGSLVHCLVLTPSEISKEFVFMPKCDLRTKAGKEIRDRVEFAAEGRLVVSEDVREQAVAMSNAVLANKSATKLLDGGRSEVSYFWTCPLTGLKFRSRADHVTGTNLIELKSGRDMSPTGFQRQAYNLSYDLSLAHYLEGLSQNKIDVRESYFITVESEAPYVVQCYKADDSFIAMGHFKWLDAITKLAAGVTEGKWPVYVDPSVDEFPLLMPPAWAARSNMFNDDTTVVI